jgi:hypothetical protein
MSASAPQIAYFLQSEDELPAIRTIRVYGHLSGRDLALTVVSLLPVISRLRHVELSLVLTVDSAPVGTPIIDIQDDPVLNLVSKLELIFSSDAPASVHIAQHLAPFPGVKTLELVGTISVPSLLDMVAKTAPVLEKVVVNGVEHELTKSSSRGT